MARDHLRTKRKLLNLSQQQLGKIVGLTAIQISSIENGYRDISSSEAISLGKVLGLEPQYVSSGQPNTAAATVIPATTLSTVTIEAVSQSQVPKPVPTCRPDLSDPANFRIIPEDDWLLRRDEPKDEFTRRLSFLQTYTNTILHTSKVPAAVWRAWRQFEKKLTDIIRISSGSSTPLGH